MPRRYSCSSCRASEVTVHYSYQPSSKLGILACADPEDLWASLPVAKRAPKYDHIDAATATSMALSAEFVDIAYVPHLKKKLVCFLNAMKSLVSIWLDFRLAPPVGVLTSSSRLPIIAELMSSL